jgi:Arc/MetJ-type ribon-helix-helix transcriptional regulator
MQKISCEIPFELAKQIERLVRDGWYPDHASVLRASLDSFVESKTFLGDSPRMLHRFAADALNESKPETALKFADRALMLLAGNDRADLALYQSIVELRVQILLVVGRNVEALQTLKDAQEKLPNNPGIARWVEKVGGLQQTEPSGRTL